MEQTNKKDCKCKDNTQWKEVIYARGGILPFNCLTLIQCMKCKVIFIKEQ